MPEGEGPLPTTFAEFMGEFREFKRATLLELQGINERLDDGNGVFTTIEVRCAGHAKDNEQIRKDITALEARVGTIEADGPQLTLRRRVQIDGTTVLTIVQLILAAISGGAKLPA